MALAVTVSKACCLAVAVALDGVLAAGVECGNDSAVGVLMVSTCDADDCERVNMDDADDDAIVWLACSMARCGAHASNRALHAGVLVMATTSGLSS